MRDDQTKASANDVVKTFYDEFGWQKDGTYSGEDNLFRAFPKAFREYARASGERTRNLFGARTGRLLVVGCGDMPDMHVEIARQFSSVTCMDISEVALDISRRKLGDRGEYVLDSIVETASESEMFDAVFCAHVVYHIDAAQQERAVRQMIRLTRPGGRIVVVYANPRSPFAIPGALARGFKALVGKARASNANAIPELYYHAHPLGWWKRFGSACRVGFVPYEVIGSRPARALLRGEAMASAFFRRALWLETKFPNLAVRLWQYPTVVLDKQ